jgi:1-acyl-sn-glycerol-3-phosphate acyltransferase
MVLSLSPAIKHAFCGTMAPPRFWALSTKSLLVSLRNAYETLAISAPTVVDAFRGTLTREASDARLESWARRVIGNARTRISVAGRENVTAGVPYVVMSNHQSHYDVAVIYSVLGGSVRMIAKKELFRFPVFGRAMEAAGFIAVDRSNHERAVASLDDAKEKLASGIPIWIAPEGTRSRTGDLLPFKKGGFVLALGTGAPILPITIRGTRDVLEAKSLFTHTDVLVSVTIHPPIEMERYAGIAPRKARETLAADVRAAIASAL